MIKDIREINFPNYATLSQATATLVDMGDKTITTQVEIDGSIVPDFSFDWEVEFKGERYIQPLRNPQALKDDSSINSKIDLTFYHWAIWQMKRYYFVELTSIESGTFIADKYIASLGVKFTDFCIALQRVLDYYFNGAIIVDVNPNEVYSDQVAFVNISYSYIWEVLGKEYEIYGVRWYIERNVDGAYVIKFGYPNNNVSHVFEYGYEKGLLSIERQVQSAEIYNTILGRGSSKNLPTYYFKEVPSGAVGISDPDAIPELANAYFDALRGKTFRDYVKGWKAKHYGGTAMSEPTEAYLQGYNDDKFKPIEYIQDDTSISKYGVLQMGLDNNEDIYPSIQNVVLDDIGLANEIVDAEQVYINDVDNPTAEQTREPLASIFVGVNSAPLETKEASAQSSYEFTIPNGKFGTIMYDKPQRADMSVSNEKLVAINKETGEQVSSINIPTGTYTLFYTCTVKSLSSTMGVIGFGVSNIELWLTSEQTDEWKPTFDIWIKNIWQSTREEGESDTAYVDRIWSPILGLRGDEASVVFSSGWLASSSDWEFKILKGGVFFDNSKSINGVPSEWRLTLIKSEAESQALGTYIPNVSYNAKAGDTFFFINIDLPQKYVEYAEDKLDRYKSDILVTTSDVVPTWVVNFDNIRINTLEDGEKDTLYDVLSVGAHIDIKDKRFTKGEKIGQYINTITYTWGNNAIIPDVQVVLSDKITSSSNPISRLQGDITQETSNRISAIASEEAARKVADNALSNRLKVYERMFEWVSNQSEQSSVKRSVVRETSTPDEKDIKAKATIFSEKDIHAKGGISAKGVADFGIVEDDSGSQVEVEQILKEGEPIANIVIDGETTTLYAPLGSGGGGSDTSSLDVVRDDELESLQAESITQVASAWSVKKIRDVVNIDDILPFDSSKSYERGEYVLYNGTAWKFVENHKGEWNSGHCKSVDINDILTPSNVYVEDLINKYFR